jgi:glycosyltransferase involved in cell wall biosynthesis
VQNWIVAQIGAREHYAVPRALHRRGRLQRLYTDAWCPAGHALLRKAPDPVRSFANRYHADLPAGRVTAFNRQAVWNALRRKWRGEESDIDRYEHHIEVGAAFARNVRDDLLNRNLNPSNTVFFGYDTGCLEVVEALRDTECVTIVDQIDPGRVGKELVLEEMERWPGWAKHAPVIHEPYEERIAREWELASAVVVNSDWSKEALVQQDVSPERIHVVPLAYDASSSASAPFASTTNDGRLKVLWLGSVILRKGIPYVMEAARRLPEVTFEIVGPVGITEQALDTAPPNMSFRGRVSRDQTMAYYREADVFVLPTLSDGFALTQLEAMAHNLPVIATPNCGRVVRDGDDGFLVPPRDAEALVEAIATLASDRERLRHMSRQARATVQQFSLDWVAERLLGMVRPDRDREQP